MVTMEFDNGILQFSTFMSVTLGIVVLFVGKRVNDVVVFLREFSIPEPVTGGLIASLLVALLYLISGIEISFDLAARDVLLIYFFTTIGVNSSLKDLLAGGKPLARISHRYIGRWFECVQLSIPIGSTGDTLRLK